MKILKITEGLFEKVFSEKNRNKIEKLTLKLAIVGFIIHLGLTFLYNYGFYEFSNNELLKNPISSVYTPFSIILMYEIYLLIFFLPRSFTTSVSKQFQIISLILIRRIFGDISKIDLDINWFKSQENLNLTYNLLGVLLLYFLIYKFDEIARKRVKQKISPTIKRFITSKKIISLTLLPILVVMFVHSFLNWLLITFFKYQASSAEFIDVNTIFYNEFFTLLILADAFILLISFRYTERYSQLIRNTGFIISTILIRLSFGTTGLTNVALIISSVLFGLLILRIYNEYEKI
ncbi:MAG: hypothetical protein CMC57_05430 [Flavobacteriaceae bacterium]|nr:hypothetical protein [Flavobacteriaceae bacterium]